MSDNNSTSPLRPEEGVVGRTDAEADQADETGVQTREEEYNPSRDLSLSATLETWASEWFPENTRPNHPIPYLTDSWHYCQNAVADLRKKLGIDD